MFKRARILFAALSAVLPGMAGDFHATPADVGGSISRPAFDFSLVVHGEGWRRCGRISGTAKYRTTFVLDAVKGDRLLRLGHVEGGVAEVFVNGVDCGVVWCAPWYAKIPAAALKTGTNALEVRVTNTWRNRLIGDCLVPPERRMTRSCLQYKTGPHNNARGEWGFADVTQGYSANDPLDSCGLYGPVSLR